MGALAHFLEDEGLPTTQISLIRLHTETIKPPRAMWVSFELGRPLGLPNDAVFQKRVLLAALKLFDAPSGPVLEDFPEDAPPSKDEVSVLSCPVDFSSKKSNLTETEALCAALKSEVMSLRPWYDMAVKKRGRTTVVVSGMDINTICNFICDFLEGSAPPNPRQDIPLAYTLNFAIDDLKAYYYEAITAQPGQESPSGKVLSDWFWGETAAAKVLFRIKEVYKKNEDRTMRIVAALGTIPYSQAFREKQA
ncbi:hypothetical protein ACFL9T_09755 [Thermodesulfobacteriota bacterium]